MPESVVADCPGALLFGASCSRQACPHKAFEAAQKQAAQLPSISGCSAASTAATPFSSKVPCSRCSKRTQAWPPVPLRPLTLTAWWSRGAALQAGPALRGAQTALAWRVLPAATTAAAAVLLSCLDHPSNSPAAQHLGMGWHQWQATKSCLR